MTSASDILNISSESSQVIADLAQRLVGTLKGYGTVAVAYSGGVDSAVVARAAVGAFGQKAVAITAVSPSLAESERQIAAREAARIGIRHVEVRTEEFLRPEYRANAGDRCFFCKDSLYTLAGSVLKDLGATCLVNGANLDDLGDHRPGMKAASDHQVRSPLIEAKINKAQVRQLASFWGLSVAEKPASPCLSSRIAYGVAVTEERVRRVEQAESFLRELLQIAEFRVRHEADELARIEVPLSELGRLAESPAREAIRQEFHRLGFRRVTVDLDGFRSGSLNDSLPIVNLEP